MKPEPLMERMGYRLGKMLVRSINLRDLFGGDVSQSINAEVHLGRELETATLGRVGLVAESARTRWVGEIGYWLTTRLRRQWIPFRFHVTADASPNAFALPGGAVLVSSSLLDLCGGQRDEVAFVLAHEIAHIVLRHSFDRIVKNSVLSLLLRRCPGMGAAAWLAGAGRTALDRAFSRDDELEADSFAWTLMNASGGDPTAGERLMEIFARQMSGRSATMLGEYFATHPPFHERLACLRARRKTGGLEHTPSTS